MPIIQENASRGGDRIHRIALHSSFHSMKTVRVALKKRHIHYSNQEIYTAVILGKAGRKRNVNAKKRHKSIVLFLLKRGEHFSFGFIVPSGFDRN